MSGDTPIYEDLIKELGDVPRDVKATAEGTLTELQRDFGFNPVLAVGKAAQPEGFARGRFPRALSA
ncbi:hypothetical protein [Streptomyces catenulae]|uniref:Uncharacterized protein n=1 Tax=Streptomyces catenulae TaxID=66875 RepID=A0ABV2YZI7_9ACTN|nr:hypothetical protein [Streptomyces catenulae]